MNDGPRGLTVAKQTWERFAERAARLQERERTGRAAPGSLGAYVRRWQRWAEAGMRPTAAVDFRWTLATQATAAAPSQRCEPDQYQT